jgi:hypothetical protein
MVRPVRIGRRSTRVTDSSSRFPIHSERDSGSKAIGPGLVPTDAALVTRFEAGSITATALLSSVSAASGSSSPARRTRSSRPAATASTPASSSGGNARRRAGGGGAEIGGQGLAHR